MQSLAQIPSMYNKAKSVSSQYQAPLKAPTPQMPTAKPVDENKQYMKKMLMTYGLMKDRNPAMAKSILSNLMSMSAPQQQVDVTQPSNYSEYMTGMKIFNDLNNQQMSTQDDQNLAEALAAFSTNPKDAAGIINALAQSSPSKVADFYKLIGL